MVKRSSRKKSSKEKISKLADGEPAPKQLSKEWAQSPE
jgi:hypothetical protein